MKLITANRASAIIYSFIKTYSEGIYILPANICPIVPLTFIKAGVKFEFIDIDSETLCISENTVLEALSKKNTKYTGMVFVHTYGAVNQNKVFFNELKSILPDFKIIDDRCLCAPNIDIIDTQADIVLYSTGYGKTLDIGHGAFAQVAHNSTISTIESEYDEFALDTLSQIYKHGLDNRETIKIENHNWLNTKLFSLNFTEYFNKISSLLPSVLKHKDRINEIYDNYLPDSIKLDSKYNIWRYNIIVKNKDKILSNIFDNSLFASSHYVPSNILFDKKYFANAETLSRRIINLFNDYNFDEDQAVKICKIINDNL